MNNILEKFQALENDKEVMKKVHSFNKLYSLKLNLSEVISQVFLQIANFEKNSINYTLGEVLESKEIIINEIDDFITPPLRMKSERIFPYMSGFGVDKHELNDIDYLIKNNSTYKKFENLPISFCNFIGYNYRNKYFRGELQLFEVLLKEFRDKLELPKVIETFSECYITDMLPRLYFNDFNPPDDEVAYENLTGAYYFYFNKNDRFCFREFYEKFKSMRYFPLLLMELAEVKVQDKYLLMDLDMHNFISSSDANLPFDWNVSLIL